MHQALDEGEFSNMSTNPFKRFHILSTVNILLNQVTGDCSFNSARVFEWQPAVVISANYNILLGKSVLVEGANAAMLDIDFGKNTP